MLVKVIKGTVRKSTVEKVDGKDKIVEKTTYQMHDVFEIDEKEGVRLIKEGVLENTELSSSDDNFDSNVEGAGDTLTDEEYNAILALFAVFELPQETVNDLIDNGYQSYEAIAEGDHSDLKKIIKNQKVLTAVRNKAKELIPAGTN